MATRGGSLPQDAHTASLLTQGTRWGPSGAVLTSPVRRRWWRSAGGSRDEPERERVFDADVVTALDDLDRSICANVLSCAAGDCDELVRRRCADVLTGDR